MIRHIVLIKFLSSVSENEISEIFKELHDMEGKISGFLSMTSGRSESPEQIERGYMHGFVADFSSWGALQTYQDHADHKKIGAKLVANAVGGLDGILVFDLTVEDG